MRFTTRPTFGVYVDLNAATARTLATRLFCLAGGVILVLVPFLLASPEVRRARLPTTLAWAGALTAVAVLAPRLVAASTWFGDLTARDPMEVEFDPAHPRLVLRKPNADAPRELPLAFFDAYTQTARLVVLWKGQPRRVLAVRKDDLVAAGPDTAAAFLALLAQHLPRSRRIGRAG